MVHHTPVEHEERCTRLCGEELGAMPGAYFGLCAATTDNGLTIITFGLEMIADFTSEPYKTMPQVLKNGLVAVATVLDFYDLPTKNVIVHSDVAYKSCPNIPREFLMQEIDKIRKGEVDVSEYAKADVEWAKKNGIMSGYNAQEFGGQDPIKRQDVAIVSHRVVNYMMESTRSLRQRVAKARGKIVVDMFESHGIMMLRDGAVRCSSGS